MNLCHPAGYHFGVGAFVEDCLVLAETPIAIVDLFGEGSLAGFVLDVGLRSSGEDLRGFLEVLEDGSGEAAG